MRLGGYELLGKIGEGGAGTVYRALAPDGATVAVKVLRSDAAVAASRFERERRLLGSLGEAEGFVPLLDAGKTDECAYLVMPFLDGGTLRARLEKGPLPIEETLELGRVLGRALGEAHARGIVHRDVKPENVIFTRAGKPLLADLGLAKHFDRNAQGASRSVAISAAGSFLGTASYMAPEQARDAASAGPEADVYALGAVLYECLAGGPAFVGDTVVELLRKIESAHFEPLAARRREAPAWLVAAIERALSRDPAKRPPDGHAFARTLAPRARRSRALAAGTALLLLLGAVLLGRDLFRRREAREHLEHGIAAYRTRANELARDELTRALALDPDLVEARVWLVMARTRLGIAARDEGDAVVALAPGMAQSWCARGALRTSLGDFAGAIADHTKALELDPTLIASWGDRALAHWKKGNLADAAADASKAIELDPRRVFAWIMRGSVRASQGDYAGAIADETRAIEIDPRVADGWRNRALARGWSGDTAGEIADETRAIALSPENATAWSNRGLARGKQGDLEGAIADLTRATELDSRLAVSWAACGRARLQAGDAAGAVADESRALEIEPGLVMAWSDRGSARARLGDSPGAREDFERAIAIDPRFSFGWMMLGSLAFERGELDLAIQDETRAIQIEPGFANAWLDRAGALGKKGDTAGAIADYERFLELVPGDARVPTVREQLARLRGGR